MPRFNEYDVLIEFVNDEKELVQKTFGWKDASRNGIEEKATRYYKGMLGRTVRVVDIRCVKHYT